MQKRPVIIFMLVLITMLALTQGLVYLQYKSFKKEKEKELLHELSIVKDKLRNILLSDVTAANTLAIIYKMDGDKMGDFDSVGHQIKERSPYVDGIQLAEGNIIKHIYPLKGYEHIIGINTLRDSMRMQEANRALHKGDVYFAGPRKLRMGGVGILGKVPIIVNNKPKAFAMVLTKLETIQKALELDDSSKDKFAYSLYKNYNNPDTTSYLLTSAKPHSKSEFVSTDIPEGDWKLTVAYSNHYSPKLTCILSLFAILFSVVTALFVYRIMQEPYLLKKIIEEKTRQLATSEKYFRTLIETSSDAVVLINPTGKVIYQTPSTDKISGYSLTEMQNIDGLELMHPDDRDEDNKTFLEIVNTPGAIVHKRHRLKQKNGEYIWIEGTYRNLLHDESVQAIVYNYADVTKTHSLELEKETMISDLLQKNKDLSEFAHLVSHNLRGPVATILGLSNLLEEDLPETEVKDLLKGIKISSENLDAVIKELNRILQGKKDFS